MKEITRIHIAKIPYDIEITAKQNIEKYIKTLEVYADDKELLQDIEIRITELLADRDIAVNGVITNDDVVSIREQLGEPKDFLSEDNQANHVIEIDEPVERKLHRNVDSAVLGGVISGIASYCKVNSVWLRLIFIAMLFFSAGTVLLAYLILWIVIPPAKTATEKLQMCGRPVTLESIRELNENGQNLVAEHRRASAVRRIIMLFIGVFLLGSSIMTLIFTIFVAFGIGHYDIFGGIVPSVQWAFTVAYILSIISGVLLSTLFAICSYIAFSLNINKRIAISIAAIVVTGLVSFGVAVGLVSYQSLQFDNQIQRSAIDTTIPVPVGFSEIKKLAVDVKSVRVKYVVDKNYRIELHSLPSDERPVVSVKGDSLNIELVSSQNARWPQLQSILTVYGPYLDKVVIKQGSVDYMASKQDMIVETVGQNSSIDLIGGIFNNLMIDAQDNSSVSADRSTAENVVVNSQTGSDVELGTVKSLDVSQPEACPADTNSEVDVQSVSSGVMRYNGKEIKASAYNANCGSVVFND